MAQKSEQKQVSIREKALETLIAIMERNVFCDKAVHQVLEENRWEIQDRRLFTRLVNGTVERAIEMDYILNQFSTVKARRMKPVIRNLLRMSVYQILYMDQIPDAAVCSEALKLAEKRKFFPLKGFVNGVLRNIVRQKEKIRYPMAIDGVQALSVRYSMPAWIVRRWILEYGKIITEEILQSFLAEKTHLTVRRQETNVSEQAFLELLEEDGVLFESGVLFPDAYRIRNFMRLKNLASYKRGDFFVQDESSMLPGRVSGIRAGDIVIDLCAAPGGKAMHAADLSGQNGTVYAADVSREKVLFIEENKKRLKASNVVPVVNDARVFRQEWENLADVVIADLPCSGLGTIGKKCDIKYKTLEEDIPSLAALQKEIAAMAVRYIKPGGRMVYSTCTMTREENEDNVFWMEKNLPLKRISIEEKLPGKLKGLTGKDGYIQVMPNQTGTDGFFVCVLQKQE